ncbi:MAG TPA: hypothetical protein PLL50_10920 [Propionicimonas sp.]|nr:hypothetical protein [Propionicimonas sp.]
MTKKYQKTVPDATALAVPEQVSIAIQPMLATREERLAGAETRVRAPRGDQQHGTAVRSAARSA